MILQDLSHKKILLLQGPLGFFFQNLAKDLSAVGAQVYKINFNGGDALFYKNGMSFRGDLSELPEFIQSIVMQFKIDTIMLFGDCRPIHLASRKALRQLKLDWYVFEEGYLRPNHITCEKNGVNGFSDLPFKASNYIKNHTAEIVDEAVIEVGRSFWYAAVLAMMYYISAWLMQRKYKHYQHHRPLTILEAWPWIKSAYRKYKYQWLERDIEQFLIQQQSKQYFLVPLQTHNDAQIHYHSSYASVESFIQTTMVSFATHASKETLLVLKQHPFDRGYKDYSKQIKRLAIELNLLQRVYFVHDQYLPALIENARGVVVINSTVGLSAVESMIPVKVCGKAVYDLPEITMQCTLDEFWHQSLLWQVNGEMVRKYLYFLQQTTQFNGNFYKKIHDCGYQAGVLWLKTKTLKSTRIHSVKTLMNAK